MTRTSTLAALAVLVLACVVAAPSSARAEDGKSAPLPETINGTIKQIVILENSKTTADTVLLVADIDEGDDWNAEVQEETRVNLVSSGLFKKVELAATAHPEGGVKLTIIAEDKHSWIVAPTYYDQPTNRGFGVGFGENNLFGENKKLLAYGQLATGDSFLIGAYIDPSIGGTQFSWAWDILLKKERIFEYEPPRRFITQPDQVRESRLNYLNSGLKLGVRILRRLELYGRIRAAWVSFDDDIELIGDHTPSDLGVPDDSTVLPKPGAEGWDVSTEGIIRFDNRANFYGVSEGLKLQFSYEKAQAFLGSDFEYAYMTAQFEKAIRWADTGNIIIKGMFGTGNDLPFQQEYTSGGTSLRGYENRQFRGDRKAAGNVEASVELFNIKGFAMRGLTFFDTSYTAFYDIDEEDTFRNYLPGAGRHGLAPFKNSAGVGTRLYIRQIVLPLLGLDLGYGLEGGGVEVYLAIGLTDV